MIRLAVLMVGALMALPVLAAGEDRDVQPSGQLEASGRGTVVLDGRLVVFGQVIGQRTRIIVRDRTQRRRRPGDATVTLNGEKLEFNRRGRINVRGVEGRFFIEGSRVQVKIVGTQISFSTAGRGFARLRGRGFYRLNDERTRRWSRRGIRIQARSSSTERRHDDARTADRGSAGAGGAARDRAGARGQAAGG